ncbi:hypothetical protein [Streptosporangium sp. V21-05]|uniref:hypothetical protein n=1 Tax=Streptosporangium sp. V21-05 TaxID=3446115 RepID=UPI003F52AF89
MTAPKPSPFAAALEGFHAALGAASAPSEKAAESMVDALRSYSYLRDRTLAGKENARRIVQQELGTVIPISGDIDGAHAEQVARLVVRALAASTALTDRALRRISPPAGNEVPR